jgi:hypothetical protein
MAIHATAPILTIGAEKHPGPIVDRSPIDFKK